MVQKALFVIITAYSLSFFNLLCDALLSPKIQKKEEQSCAGRQERGGENTILVNAFYFSNS